MKITESILIETDPFEPELLAEALGLVSVIIRQSRVAEYAVIKSSIKTDEPRWQIAVLMRRPSTTSEQWLKLVEAIGQDTPF